MHHTHRWQNAALALLIAAATTHTARAQSRVPIVEKERQSQTAYLQLDQTLTGNSPTVRALQWLYAYMPLPDVTNYPLEFYQREVATTLRAREEMPWGATVPEREWLHFVLPLRVNNEALDAFRSTCYDELKRRVAGLTMEQAVLEVNRWCHEYATYTPSDARTLSPLSTKRNALGRCGEESTFTVAALRTVGIPARQVYTPRWAHTDSNHAWVEAWIDGRWRFFGACEPEAVLDLGWFNAPASRGMLMHTRVFGPYDGPEDKITVNRNFTEINITGNYAQTAASSVRVVDQKGRPVSGAKLEFKIFNTGELNTVYATTTDAQGRARITSGLGDLIAWASHDGRFGLTKVTAGGQDVPVVLQYAPGDRFSLALDLIPPRGHNNLPAVAPELAALNEQRKATEDSIRNAYVAAFPNADDTRAFAAANGYDFDQIRPLIEKSRGNHEAIYRLLSYYRGRAIVPLLRALTDKDLIDLDPTILMAQLDASALPAQLTDFQARYIYSPRVAHEPLSAWHAGICERIPAKDKMRLRRSPQRIVEWIGHHTRLSDDWNANSLWQTPVGALTSGHTDSRSRHLLYVAIARTLGIPSRIDPVTGKVQWADAREQWHDVLWQKAAKPAPKANLQLAYTPTAALPNPRYYNHFSLSRIEGGSPSLLNYDTAEPWSERFAQPTQLDAGAYLLVSGTRLADGGVLTQLEGFALRPSTTTTIPLTMRHDDSQVEVIGGFDAELPYHDLASGTQRGIIATTGRGYYTLGLVRPNHEPTNHILHDLSARRAELEAWGRPILLLFETQSDWERFQLNNSEFNNLPNTIVWGIDTDGRVRQALETEGLAKGADRPMVIVADTFNRVVFRSQGYTIGLGETLQQLLQKLKP